MLNLNRRGFGAGLCAAAVGAVKAAASTGATGLEGTWGGAKGDLTAQVIITGRDVIGWFWRDDYVDTRNVKFAEDGHSVSFDFASGAATLTRTGDRTASLEVREAAGATRLDLTRD